MKKYTSHSKTVRSASILLNHKSRIVVKDTPADNALSDSTQQKWDSYFNHGVVISLAGLLPINPTYTDLYFSHTEFTSPTLHLYLYTDFYHTVFYFCLKSMHAMDM